MSKTLVISDIHLGDLRLLNVEALYTLLLNESYDRLVLAGDIIDLWLSNWDALLKTELLQLLQKISETKETIWVIGNHDSDIIKNNITYVFPKISFTDIFKMEDGGKRFLILHGNQVYSHQDESWIARMTAKLNYFIWRHFDIDIQRISNNTKYYLKYIDNKRGQIIKNYGNDIDIIIIGHTHKIGRLMKGNVELFDLGAFIKMHSYGIIENGIVNIGVKE